MTAVVVIALTAAATGLAALLAHEGRAVYHDGLRLLVRETLYDPTRRPALATDGWAMSSGFILWFALPVSLLSGVMIAHLVFLPADILGIRIRRRAPAVLAAVTFAALTSTAVVLAGEIVANPRFGLSSVPQEFGGVAAALVPLIPIVAGVRLDARRYGLAGAICGSVGWLIASDLRLDTSVFMTCAACLPLIAAAAERRSVEVDLDVFGDQFERIRRSALPLATFAGLVGGLGGMAALAGEPLAAWLLVSGRPALAATVAVVTAAGMMPLVATSSMSSGVYSTQGYPDWLLAPGYVGSSGPFGAGSAVLLMLVETTGLRRVVASIVRHPEITSVAAALRASSEEVLVLCGSAGAVIAASDIWGSAGILAFGIAYLLNESTGARVPRFAIGPSTIVLLCGARVAATVLGA